MVVSVNGNVVMLVAGGTYFVVAVVPCLVVFIAIVVSNTEKCTFENTIVNLFCNYI